jgi:guanylate kinase
VNRSYIFVVSGPSGCGKTTLIRNLLKDKELKGKLARSISFTTRPKRPGEKEGVDYFFITEPRFKKLLREKKILEWTRFLNYYYGTPREYVDGQLGLERSIALCLDIKGAMRLKTVYGSRAITIFILPPSIESLKERIHKRGCHTDGCVVESRMKIAANELLRAREYDHRLINDNFSLALKKLKGIISKRLHLKGESYARTTRKYVR